MLRYFCCDERRRADVGDPSTPLNGIDFLEVVDHDAPTEADRQRILRIHFVKPPAGTLLDRLNAIALNGPNAITPENVRISGGVRIRNVHADGVAFAGGLLEIHVNVPGDYSPYTLSLVEATGGSLADLDPMLSVVDFSFKVECPTDLDCRSERVCPPEAPDSPQIDYLAKDYASFRQLMLDRLSVIAPQWKERNPADLGIALVELLAYVGDRLSYEQDAVATEAYLYTARRRSSVRRHSRLLDYLMHDGCNARTWVQVRVNTDMKLPQGTQLLTTVGGATTLIPPDGPKYVEALSANPVVFETMEEGKLFQGYERMEFYSWGERDCCLPQGATSATLSGKLDKLAKGTVLVFVEDIGPRTGNKPDADPAHRHAVRLTSVGFTQDPLHNVDVTEIEWDEQDELPFALCISATTDEEHGRAYLPVVSVALGNIVLADHGRSISEDLPLVPASDPRLAAVLQVAGSPCDPREPEPVPPRYRPRLTRAPLTMAGTVTKTGIVEGRRRRLAFDKEAPASAAFGWDMDRTLPAITALDSDGRTWFPQRDLLSSDEFALEFLAEVEEDGLATLRFGDDEYGQRPASFTGFTASYRIGNGVSGNIGAGSISHVVTLDTRIDGVHNPLPARGGTEPETIEKVRQDAPSAFRVQQRAVTPADYAEVAERHPQVQRAAATLRWTGSWHTVFLTIDRTGGREVDAGFEAQLRGHMERFRMAGHDLEIDGPSFVPLEIEMFVCVQPDFYRSDVKAALLELFSNRTFPDGRRGFFHPDNFTFGQPVYLSRLYAVAQAVQGVRFVEFRKFQRLGVDSLEGVQTGSLQMGALEIARLDNDPNFRERGLMTIDLEGGR